MSHGLQDYLIRLAANGSDLFENMGTFRDALGQLEDILEKDVSGNEILRNTQVCNTNII